MKGRCRKWTVEEVTRIHALRDNGMTYTEIAKQYGIDRKVIQRIALGQTRPLRNQRVPFDLQIAAKPEVKSAFDEFDVRRLRQRGYSKKQIAAMLRRPYRDVEAMLS